LLQKLPNESAVNSLHQALLTAKDQTSLELQKNVFKNYNEFVIISKEITKLEKDMLSCKKILVDLKEVKEAFNGALPQEKPEFGSIKTDKKNENLDKEAKLGGELLKIMYKEIEGLQVYVNLT
jgi:hypothetical protein